MLDKANENFQEAAEIRGTHQHRAQKGLGDVWLYMGTIAQKKFHQDGATDVEILDISQSHTTASEIMAQLLKHSRNMAQALEHASVHYTEAAEIARQLDDTYVTLSSELALASTMWTEGQLLYISDEYDDAIVKMNISVESYTAGDHSLLERAVVWGDLRLVTHSYQTLGLAYIQLSDMLRTQNRHDERLIHLEKAKEFFQKCVSQKDEAALDKLILNEMIADFCEPHLTSTEQMLEEALTHPGEQQ